MVTSIRAAAVVLAGGSGTRMGGETNKVYLPLAGRAVVSWSLLWASQVESVTRLVLVTRAADADLARDLLRRELPDLTIDVVTGGATRHDSEQAALDHLADEVSAGRLDVIAIHDGARPLAGPQLWATVIRTAAEVGGAVPALPATGLIRALSDGDADGDSTPDERLVRVQTPQAFRAAPLVEAYRRAVAEHWQGTDTDSCVARYSDLVVQAIAGWERNLKITFTADMGPAARWLHDRDRPD